MMLVFFLACHAAPAQAQRKEGRSTAEQLTVFPNPTAGKVNIIVKEQEHQYDINIYNLMGDMVFHWEANDQGQASLEVDLSRHPDGIYFVELDTDKANVVKRVIIDRHR